MLKCLKDLSAWDPSGAEEKEKEIWQSLADEAGVDLETFNSAKNIIWWDGHFGPHTDEDYAEEGHKITKVEATRIIDAARGFRFSDIEFQNPEYPETCDCNQGDEERDEPYVDCTHTNCTISGSSIYDEIWKWYREIYG